MAERDGGAAAGREVVVTVATGGDCRAGAAGWGLAATAGAAGGGAEVAAGGVGTVARAGSIAAGAGGGWTWPVAVGGLALAGFATEGPSPRK